MFGPSLGTMESKSYQDSYKPRQPSRTPENQQKSRGADTREVCWLFGHNFVWCRSYGLGIWQDFSPMSPLPSYSY